MDSFIEMLYYYDANFQENFVINESLYDRAPVKKVITDEIKNNLEKILYKNAKNKEKYAQCCITQDEFKDDDEILQLPCGHCFFYDSIIKWLTEESCACPICKNSLDSKELIVKQPIIDWNIESDYIIPYQNNTSPIENSPIENLPIENSPIENFFIDFFTGSTFLDNLSINETIIQYDLD